MTNLIACLSTGKGSWLDVKKLISTGSFEKCFLITNDFGKEKFQVDSDVEFVVIDNRAETEVMTKAILEGLSGKVSGEVALNMNSGSGKEHMALLAAVMKLGLGFRLIEPTDEGIREV